MFASSAVSSRAAVRPSEACGHRPTLASLRPRQVIESNDLVGTTVAVSEVGLGSVMLSEVGPLHRIDCTYDARTGMLSAMTLVQQIGLAQITHSIQLVGQQ